MTFRSSGSKINYKKEFKNEEKLMSIFDEQVARKPDNYPWAKDFIYAMLENPWNDREFTFSSDLHDFKTKMTNEEKEMLIKTLSAIGQIEIAVKTFWAKLGEHLPHPSIMDLGCVMAQVECVHNLAYERLLSVLDMNSIFEENMKLDCISGRVKYLKKYNHKFYKDAKKQYVYALILFTLFVENVSLFSQFYIILWLNKNKNILKDTAQQVKYTSTEECYIDGTEVLTPKGWINLKDININDEVYQYCQDGMFEITKVLHKTSNNFSGNMIKFSKQSHECIVTPDHDMVFFTKAKGFQKKKAKEIKIHKNTIIPIGGYLRGASGLIKELSYEDKLRLAIQADGSNLYWTNTAGNKLLRGSSGGYTHSIRLTRQRKQIRLKEILSNLNLEYSEKISDEETNEIEFKIRYNQTFNYKTLDWVDFSNKSQEWCREFVEECSKWDGFELDNNGIGYCSIVKKNIDTVQVAAILSGYATNISEGNESSRNPNYSNCYKLHMTNRNLKPRSHGIKKNEYGYTGKTYCITVQSGAIITRYNNKTFISGNCAHAAIGTKLVNTIREELPELFDQELEHRVAHEAQEALNAESKIVDWMLGDFEHETLNKVLLKEFIKNRINKSLIDIKFKPIFEVDDTVIQKTNWFNEIVLGDNMVDFFNSRPTDYSRSNQSFDPENLF